MKIAIFFIGLLSASFAFANTAETTSANLIGTWLCEATDKDANGMIVHTQNRLTYRADGSASENINISYYLGEVLHTSGNITVNYAWQLLGGRQSIENLNVHNYSLYNHTTQATVPDGVIAWLRQDLINQYQANPWQNIRFIDKDTHEYSSNGISGVCVRQAS